MEKLVADLSFFRNKKIFLTGHTGFKGSWLCRILAEAGAIVTGFSLPPEKENLFDLCNVKNQITSVYGDIRNFEALLAAFKESAPELVVHLAAQPLVRQSYEQPAYTYEVNVMGTVNLLECIRQSGTVKSVLNVTTDKVYHNNEWNWGYRENDPLDGYDPYSNSKSCSELVTHSYINSFFNNTQIAVSTARAGNVIGGGDFAKDRIIPDCNRAAFAGEPIIIRNPYSTRPYQHVLEPLFAYLMILQKQYHNYNLSGFYNIGPDDKDCVTTGRLATLFCEKWGAGAHWENQCLEGPHEANFLKLDCSKVKATFGWEPCWGIDQAIEKTVEWSKAYYAGEDIPSLMDSQIDLYGRILNNV